MRTSNASLFESSLNYDRLVIGRRPIAEQHLVIQSHPHRATSHWPLGVKGKRRTSDVSRVSLHLCFSFFCHPSSSLIIILVRTAFKTHTHTHTQQEPKLYGQCVKSVLLLLPLPPLQNPPFHSPKKTKEIKQASKKEKKRGKKWHSRTWITICLEHWQPMTM